MFDTTETIRPERQSLIDAYRLIMLSSKDHEEYPPWTLLRYDEENNTVELCCDGDGSEGVVLMSGDLMEYLGGGVDDCSDDEIEALAQQMADQSEFNTFEI